MSCSNSLQTFGLQGLIIGACLGAGLVVYKRLAGETSESQLQKQIMRYVVQFGVLGCVLGLIYGAIKSCINV